MGHRCGCDTMLAARSPASGTRDADGKPRWVSVPAPAATWRLEQAPASPGGSVAEAGPGSCAPRCASWSERSRATAPRTGRGGQSSRLPLPSPALPALPRRSASRLPGQACQAAVPSANPSLLPPDCRALPGSAGFPLGHLGVLLSDHLAVAEVSLGGYVFVFMFT